MKDAVPFLIAVWIPAIMMAFRALPKHRAVIVAFVAGILFLPGLLEKKINADAPDVLPFPFFPFTKQNVITLAVFLSAVVYDKDRLLAFRFRRFDIPMMLWCLCPFLSAVANNLPGPEINPVTKLDDNAIYGKFVGVYIGSLYDGFSQSRIQFLTWGVPYFLGRIYFNDMKALKELAVGMLLGAIVYVPLCLFEWKMSPILHKLVYGFDQHEAGQAQRGDSWRPVVFMEHGLAVGMWLSATMLAAFWFMWVKLLPLWQGKAAGPPHLKGWAARKEVQLFGILFGVLLGTSVLIKSGGAFMLGILGLLCLLAITQVGPRPVIFLVACLGPIYMVGRMTSGVNPEWTARTYNRWEDEKEIDALEKRALQKQLFGGAGGSAQDLASTVSSDEERQKSFTFRLVNEDKIMARAKYDPNTKTPEPWYREWVGFGGWNRSKLVIKEGEFPDEKEKDWVTADALWIITYRERGVIGVILLYAAMLFPLLRLAWIYPKQYWSRPEFAMVAVGTVFLAMWMVDNLLNNMFNPVYVLIAGGIMGLTATGKPVPLEEGAASARGPVRLPPVAAGLRRELVPGAGLAPVLPANPPVPATGVIPAVPPPPTAQPPPVPQAAEPRKPGLLRRRLPGQPP